MWGCDRRLSGRRHARHRARLRIFTPGRELPFAGHPTVGTAVLLALQDPARGDARAFGLEEAIGIVPCVVETLDDGSGGRARFRLPVLPEYLGPGPDPEILAPRLGLQPGDLGTGRHAPSRHGVGPCFTCVPVASVAALDAARPAQAPEPGDGLYLYTPDPEGTGQSWRVRMFAPDLGVPEDPATGAAAAALAGYLRDLGWPHSGKIEIIQGEDMGMRSQISVQIPPTRGKGVRVSGNAYLLPN